MASSEHYGVEFHGIQYVLTVLVATANGKDSGKTLLVDIEQEASGARWTGEFAAKYVEDITQKTGNFKRFSVFVNMLRKALSSGSDSVFVDLLTAADLNELKHRRSGKSVSASMNSSATGSTLGLSRSSMSTGGEGKRYLIMTYTAEFDKVHYPLPLAFEDNPSPATLQRTISRLRSEIANGGATTMKRGSNGGGGGLGAGNASELQRQLHAVRAENEMLRKNKGNAAAVEARIAFQKYRETSQAEIAQLKKDCKHLASKLRDSRTKSEQIEYKYEKAKGGSNTSSTSAKMVRTLERKNKALQQTVQREKDAARRSKSTTERQLSKLKKEMSSTKSQLTRLRMELREANKRASIKTRGSSSTPRGARSVERRGRSSTPRGGTSARRSGARDRSTSSVRSNRSTRSGRSMVNTSRTSVNSVNTSTSSRLSRRSTTSNNSSNSAARRRRAAARRTPSPAYGRSSSRPSTGRSSRPSTGRRSNISNNSRRGRSTTRKKNVSSSSGKRRTTTTTTTRKKRGGASTGRRSKRHPSPFGDSSGDSRSSSLESRHSVEPERRTRIGRKQTKQKKQRSTARDDSLERRTNFGEGDEGSGIPRGPPREPPAPQAKQTSMLAPPTENASILGNVESSVKELESSIQRTEMVASRLEENVTTTNFNANSEMADIDRRLNALQVRRSLFFLFFSLLLSPSFISSACDICF